MALTRTFLGQHPTTGEPWYHYESDDDSKSVLITGPATGDLTLADGTTYNVSEAAIEVDPSHVDELCHLIGLQHEETGRFDVSASESPTGEPIQFKHECPHCTSTRSRRSHSKTAEEGE